MSDTTALLLKLTLAPGLVGAASLISRRIGPRLGGVITGLPVVTGPILYLYAIEQGSAFAAAAATQTLFGTLALLTYCAVYAALGQWRARSGPNERKQRVWPFLCMLAGWCAFVMTSAMLRQLHGSARAGIAVALASVLTGLALLRHMAPAHSPALPSNGGLALLFARMVAACLLVSTLSTAAMHLGATWSGLLAAFPVVSTVMLVATHLELGWFGALQWLRGFFVGLFGYVAFVSVMAHSLVPLGNAPAFTLGVSAAILCQLIAARACDAG
jgi:hypothetical protein